MTSSSDIFWIPETTDSETILNFEKNWKSWSLANSIHPNCDEFIGSLAAIRRERSRQRKHKNWLIVHPFSLIRFIWEIIMTFVYAISFMVIPFMTSFIVFNYDDVKLDEISPIIYKFYYIDIILNVITGVYDKSKKTITFDQNVIFQKYWKGYLVIDILTSLPYDHWTYQWRTIPGSNSSLFIAVINLIPIFKIIRYPTFNAYTKQFFSFLEVKYFKYRIINTMLLSFYIIFWFTCFCYLTPVMMTYIYQINIHDCSCWLTKVEKKSVGNRFQHALFIVLQNLVASGFGGIQPESTGHTIISTFLMILGRMFEGYIIILFIQIKKENKSAEAKFDEMMNQLSAYARQKQLTPHINQRLKAYYFYRFRNSYFREKKILSILSARLREEIVLYSCRRLVENVVEFRILSPETITSIVLALKFELYLPHDTIIKAGTIGDCMFFISSGTVAVLTPTGKEICHLEDGAYFGEIALLVQDKRRVASVVAIEVCEVYRLNRRNFRKCIAPHPELFQLIERIASERIDRTNMIDEKHKRYPTN